MSTNENAGSCLTWLNSPHEHFLMKVYVVVNKKIDTQHIWFRLGYAITPIGVMEIRR